MVSDKVAARAGNQWDELLDQLMRREHDACGAIPPNLLEAQSKPTVWQFLKTVVGNRRSGQVATQVFQAVAIVGAHAHIRVNIETGDLRTSLAYDCSLGILAGASQAQYAAASARARRNQALHGGIGQMVKRQLVVFVF
jgi:hypothetical protein